MSMRLKGLVHEDFINYKKPCMYIISPSCTWKCNKECGKQVCQNSALASEPVIDTDIDRLVEQYIQNPITQSVVFGGLEPLDSCGEVIAFLQKLRSSGNQDDVVIYTGYTEEEAQEKLKAFYPLKNIIVKFGRFIPDQTPHHDPVIGINLASDNQYAKKIC